MTARGRRSSTGPFRSPPAEGLEGLSIGRLAGDLGVSKSGLFAHFGSKTDLQLATVDVAREIFIEEVIGGSRTGLRESGGLLSLTDAWLSYMEREVFRGGCFFAAASIEFDSRPGPVRDRIASMMGEWLLALEAAIQDAQDAGELPAVIDSEQLAFEINSIGMGANWAFQLYRDEAAFERAREAIRQRISDPAPQKSPARRARFRSRRTSTRAPPGARCATRSPSSSASWRPCSPTPTRGARSSGRSARPAARACSTSATSRRCATSSPCASRTRGARFASAAKVEDENRERSRR